MGYGQSWLAADRSVKEKCSGPIVLAGVFGRWCDRNLSGF